jgi:hypothetical protein
MDGKAVFGTIIEDGAYAGNQEYKCQLPIANGSSDGLEAALSLVMAAVVIPYVSRVSFRLSQPHCLTRHVSTWPAFLFGKGKLMSYSKSRRNRNVIFNSMYS